MDSDFKEKFIALEKQVVKLNKENSGIGCFYSENKHWIRFFSVAFIMTGLFVHATVPNVFSPNKIISSSAMNANFDYLEQRQGVVVAIVESAGTLSFNNTSPQMNFDGSMYHLNDLFIQGNVTLTDGNVSSLGSNLVTAYTAPSEGWYEIFIQGDVSVTVDPGNIVPNNNLNISMSFRRGEVISGVFVTKEWLSGINASANMNDSNADAVIDINNPQEYNVYRKFGNSEKVFLKTGQSLGFALNGGLKLVNDSINLNYFKVTIKKLTL